MAEVLQKLVDHFQTQFVDGDENARADFTADVESWARVHGLVMGNGQVRRAQARSEGGLGRSACFDFFIPSGASRFDVLPSFL